MIYIALIAALAGSNASSLATEATAVVVPYADLDLASGRARSVLNRRVIAAARLACEESRVPSAAQQKRISECTKAALQRAERDVEVALAKRGDRTELARNEIGEQ
jgi:UrcA family protein